MSASRPARLLPWTLLWLAALGAAYLPDLGHGFVKDDFAWIAGSRVEGWADLLGLFSRDNGFYRPLVSLSFALDHALHGLNPQGYAATNLVLVLLSAALLALLARALGMGPGPGLLAAALFSLNPHGIGGALLWISGRTSLLLVLFSLLAALALVRGRPLWSAALAWLALLSKEEAVLLPFVLAAWAALGFEDEDRRPDLRRGLVAFAGFVPGLVLYFLLRARTAAYLPATAPSFYAPTLDPAHLLRNVLEYADRAATFPAALVLLPALVLRRAPRLEPREKRWVGLGLVWLCGGYGLTVFLPVRSSLYACFPSAGAALAAAAGVRALWRGVDPRTSRRLLLAAAAVPLLLVPLLRSRNVRLERTARLSARTLAEIAPAAPELRSGRVLVLKDRPAERVNLAGAFGTLLESAVRLTTGVEQARAWLEPPPPDWRAAGLRPPGDRPAIVYELRDGRVVRVP